MQRLIIATIVSICAAAVGRGIVLAFGLDVLVARMIQGVVEFPRLPAIAWSLSGLFGLLCLVLCLGLRLDERIYHWISPSPDFGSLIFQAPFVGTIAKNLTTGHMHMELVANLKNTNRDTVGVTGSLLAEANGKQAGPISVDTFVAGSETTSLIMRVPDMPPLEFAIGKPSTSGFFEYDLQYFVAPHGRKKRRTKRKIWWELRVPIGTGRPGESGYPIHVLFDEEKIEL